MERKVKALEDQLQQIVDNHEITERLKKANQRSRDHLEEIAWTQTKLSHQLKLEQVARDKEMERKRSISKDWYKTMQLENNMLESKIEKSK